MSDHTFYIATNGNDTWRGTLAEPNAARTDGPFATLERARDAIRLLEGGATVWVRDGVYPRNASFALVAEDSGTAQAPITYRACAGEQVQFLGGCPVTNWQPVTDPVILGRLDPAARAHVVQADLNALGITDLGQLRSRGFGRPIAPAHLELFFDGQPMTLARYPNQDAADPYVHIADLPADSDRFMEHKRWVSRNQERFIYDDDRPKRWQKTDDIWMHGYWTWDWANSYEQISTIDTDARLIATHEPHGVYGYSKGQHYYYLNILEELDSPGEFYLDRDTGILYFWPPSPIEEGRAMVSVLEEPLVVMENVSHVTLRGFTFECSRGHGITITGGTGGLVAGCTLRNLGNHAVVVEGGTEHGVVGCDVYNVGDGGILLEGGDRATLTPGGHYAVNNDVHHMGRWSKCYRPGIMVSGVGHRIAHNHIHDGPHNGIQLHGNDNLIEFNELHHVCLETGDVGAFYMGRDWTERGNLIRFNSFHHIGGVGMGSMSVYLDDWASGTTIYGNIFAHTIRAMFIGSGRDNRVENNIFMDCHPAVHVDARGLGWASYYFDGTTTTLFDRLAAMNYQQPPYSLRYPELVRILEDEPVLPKGNRVLRNVFHGGTWLHFQDGVTEEIVDVRDNLTEGDPCFVDSAHENYQLRDDSPAYALGFVRIPAEKIGLVADAYRPR